MSALSKRRKELRTELGTIERQIYDLETSYLEETKEFGNIFTGWDSYLSKEKVKVRKAIFIEDRKFSLSSITSPASKKEESKSNKVGKKRKHKSGTKDDDNDDDDDDDDDDFQQNDDNN
jgi:chromatin modification-related protein EAF6